MQGKRKSRIRFRKSRRPKGRRRRELLVIFALIFGTVGTRGMVHARPVPFATPPPISTSANGAFSVHAADVDGDGDLDALSASVADDKIAWYENAGGGGTSWVIHTISTSANGALSVYAADVDGDGDLDALSASYNDDKIAWYENVGGGGTSWVIHMISTNADGARSVYAADVDGDGDLDALSASSTDDKIAWYENASGGGTSWVIRTISTNADGARSVYAADVDGDGDLDALSVSIHDDRVAWHENAGGGGTSWALHVISTSANGAISVYAADVDGDGDLDALSSSYFDGKVAWYENAGGGTSWTIHTIATNANAVSVYVADLDGDGDVDVLLPANYGDTIGWYENVGGGGTSWAVRTIATDPVYATAVYAADVDGDGDLDVLSAARYESNAISWYRNDSIHRGVTFASPSDIATGVSGPFSVYAADVDGDGDVDALSASLYDDRIAWYENVGGGGASWVSHTISTSADGPFSVHAADVDGDGDLDALSASQEDDKIAWYENVGGGGTAWTPHTISTGADRALSVHAADVDGDGDLDALSASIYDTVTWYENVGGGGTSWTPHAISTLFNRPSSVHAADVDGDGDVDALSASLDDDAITWYENVGGGGTSWTLRTISLETDTPLSVYAADVDGDGDLDALSASVNDDKIVWYENLLGGGGTAWFPHTLSTSADYAYDVHAADMDRDGDIDVLSASLLDDKIAWYENVGGGGASWALHTISTSADEATSVFAADVDGDGDLDALSASRFPDNTIAWYENRLGGMGLYTVTPCRLLDTRITGQGPALTTGNRELVVPPNCGIPVDALAVAVNVTAVSATVGGHVTVFPGGTAVPGTSTINFSAGQTRANNQIVGLAPDFSGKLILRAVVPGGEVHFLVDVVGYF